MTSGSRLLSGVASDGPLRVMILGSADLPRVRAEADRLATLLASLQQDPRPLLFSDSESEFPRGPTAADLVVVLGGDGSILRAARWMGYNQAPVLGVNLGRLGFLADVPREGAAEALTEIIAGRFRLVDHLMFETEVIRNGVAVQRELGLNETSVLAGPPFGMIEFGLVVDGEPATTYRADGLIVSTPVGSTAYNLSAGGPIVRKDLDAFVFTPLSPHTLTNRTVVDSAARTYEIVVPQPNTGSACVVDGRVIAALSAGDRIRIRKAKPRFVLVETGRHGYYRTLREKLTWGGDLRAATTPITGVEA